VLSKERVVEDDVEFCGTCCYGGTCFLQLVVCVLCSFMEANNAGYENVGTFKVGDAALYII
jgi:hypothetical protein